MNPLKRPQKEKERRLFEQLNKLLKLNSSEIKQPEPPNPDIFVIVDEKLIGVEISELYSDNHEFSSRLARNESIRDKVIELAIRRIEKVIDYSFELHVSFDRNEILDNEVLTLSGEIATIVINQLRDVQPSKEWNIIKYESQDFKSNLSRMSIYVSDQLDKNYFSAIAADWIPHLSEQNLQTSIAKKELKIESYKSKSHEVWLLLVELGGIASAFDDMNQALKTTYISGFDKVFILRSMQNDVLEIKICG